MVIALNPEQARVIDRAIEAGLISDAENAIEDWVGMLRQQLDTKVNDPNDLPYEEWARRFQAWVNRKRPEAPLLSDEALVVSRFTPIAAYDRRLLNGDLARYQPSASFQTDGPSTLSNPHF